MPNIMNLVRQISPGTFIAGYPGLAGADGFTYLEGAEFDDNDQSWVKGTGGVLSGPRSGGGRTYRIVRNMSATAVTGGQLVIPSLVAGFGDKRTNGPQTAAAAMSYAVDPALITCPQYGLYLIVVAGVTQVNNAAGANVQDDIVVSTTTSGDGATIANGSVTAVQAANKIGRCVGPTGTTVAGKCDVLISRNP